jgi:putative addiction module component (TIGR02574 family)
MTAVAEEMKSKLATLSDEDRAELAYFLIRSLKLPREVETEEELPDLLERRMREIDAGTAKLTPADEVLSRLRQKYLTNAA